MDANDQQVCMQLPRSQELMERILLWSELAFGSLRVFASNSQTQAASMDMCVQEEEGGDRIVILLVT